MSESIEHISELKIIVYLLLFYLSGFIVCALATRSWNNYSAVKFELEKLKPGVCFASWVTALAVLLLHFIAFMLSIYIIAEDDKLSFKEKVNKFFNYE